MASRRIILVFFCVLFLVGGVSAAPQFLAPIDQTSDDYQDSFGSGAESDGEKLEFKVTLDSVPSDGDLTLYRKDEHGKTFSEVTTIQANSDFVTQTYYLNHSQSFTLSDGESTTVTIDGEEHTFEVDSVQSSTQAAIRVDGVLDNYDLGEFFQVSGQDVRVWDIVYLGNGEGQVQFRIPTGSIQVPEFESSYRVQYKPESAYSEQIYLSVDDPDETPFLQSTKIEGTQIFDYNRKTVSPTASIEANIQQDQGDDFNLSLYDDNTGDLVAWSKTNGTSDNTYVHIVKDTFYGLAQIVIDTSSNTQFNFPTTGSSLLAAASQDDSYYFKIEDIDDNSHRLTPVFQTETSGSNDPPTITGIEGYTGSTWKNITSFGYGESLDKIRVNVDDSNNNLHGAKLYLEDVNDSNIRVNYSTDFVAKAGNVYEFTVNQEVNDSGRWKVSANVTDGSAEDKAVFRWSVPWGNWTNQSFTVNDSAQDLSITQYENFSVNFTASCSGGECQNTGDHSNIYLNTLAAGPVESCSSTPFCLLAGDNPQNTSTGELRPGESYSFTWDVNATGGSGNYTLQANISSTNTEAGSATSVQRDVEITVNDVTPPEIKFLDDTTAAGNRVKNWIFINVSAQDESGLNQVLESFDGTNSSFTGSAGKYYWENHTGLSTGTYEIRAWAEDTSDNWNSTGLRTITIESNSAPSITVSDPDNLTYSSTSIPVDVATSDSNNHGYNCDIKDNTTKIGSTNETSQSFKETLSKPDLTFNNLTVACTDDFGASSSKSVYYTVNTSTGSSGGGGGGGGSSGGGGGTTTIVIGNVTGDKYSWKVSAALNEGATSFRPVEVPGGTVEKQVELENTGNRSVNLSLRCQSSDGSCQRVTLSQQTVTLEVGEVEQVTVRGKVPETATTSDVFQYSIVVSDPEDNQAKVDFYVSVDPFLGGLLNYFGKFFSTHSSGIPYTIIGLLIGLLAYTGLSLAGRFSEIDISEVVKVVVAALIFLISVAVI